MCTEFSIAVSGSNNKIAIIWDLRKKKLLRVLDKHNGAVVSVSINNVCGHVLTLTHNEIRLYTINGVLLAVSDMCLIGNLRPKALNVLALPLGDWQDGVIAVTGHETGFLIAWKVANRKLSKFSYNVQNASESSELVSIGCREITGIPLLKTHRSDISVLKLGHLNSPSGNTLPLIPKVFNGEGGYELLVGDLDGYYSRWMAPKLDQIDSSELQRIFPKE